MSTELIISIAGTFLTAIGTGVTVWQAKKVKGYSEKIRIDRLKTLLIDNITTSEIIKRESSKLRTPVNKEFARGFDVQKTLNTIENYLCDIKELAVRFELDDIKKAHAEIDSLIKRYKIADDDLRLSIGDEIDSKVNDLIITMKSKAFDS
ncbi:MAG: hypothetical protein FH753_13115 [Firmicutes bacterium]|nr:hypothetical protein [Bacillota bacterium]